MPRPLLASGRRRIGDRDEFRDGFEEIQALLSGLKTLLLAGVSVRMLAQSAARAGIRPVCLDWFADEDTAESSVMCRAVSDGIGFDSEKLLWAAERYAPARAGSALIYGSGFDGHPELLSQLARGRLLWGNSPETVQRVKTPADFFRVLDRLLIPYPETRWTLPERAFDPSTWLAKPISSEGGVGIRLVQSDLAVASPAQSGIYFQQKIPGTPRSALFLANGSDAEIIGFNTLYTSDHVRQQPFLFAGARSHCRLRPRQRAAIRDYTIALTRALSLKGINSLDFMIDEDEIRVLEINPRPSATMMLHDADYPDGLLACHVDACRGSPIGRKPRSAVLRGVKILYAYRAMSVPAGFTWPAWCSDRPRAGTSIKWGRPVCSIRAESRDHSTLERQLSARERLIRSSLMF